MDDNDGSRLNLDTIGTYFPSGNTKIELYHKGTTRSELFNYEDSGSRDQALERLDSAIDEGFDLI